MFDRHNEVRSGSSTTDAVKAARSSMSASRRKADMRELTAICLLRAKSDRMQRSKKSLLDRIVGAACDFA